MIDLVLVPLPRLDQLKTRDSIMLAHRADFSSVVQTLEACSLTWPGDARFADRQEMWTETYGARERVFSWQVAGQESPPISHLMNT